MPAYAVTFFVAVIAAAVMTLLISVFVSDPARRRVLWKLPFQAAVGVTFADVISDFFHPIHDHRIRVMIVGLSFLVTSVLIDWLLSRFRSNRKEATEPSANGTGEV